MDISNMGAWTDTQVGTQTFAPPDENTLYLVFFPSATTLSLKGSTGCAQILGYHGVSDAKAGYAFAAVGRCQDFENPEFDTVTITASHEILEAVTDPSATKDSFGWVSMDGDHWIWGDAFDSELGDFCQGNPEWPNSVKPSDLGYSVQKIWSNAWAKAGHNPCAPNDPSTPFYGAGPAQGAMETVMVTTTNATFNTQGVIVPVGQTKTIDVQLFSDAPTSDWSVQAIDWGQFHLNRAQELDLSLDQGTGNNGTVLHLSIHAIAKGVPGYSTAVLSSSPPGSTDVWWRWPILVVNQ
jgi:hypothetical protein